MTAAWNQLDVDPLPPEDRVGLGRSADDAESERSRGGGESSQPPPGQQDSQPKTAPRAGRKKSGTSTARPRGSGGRSTRQKPPAQPGTDYEQAARTLENAIEGIALLNRLATAPADEPIDPAVAQAVWESVTQVCGWHPEHDAESVARSYLAASRVPKKTWSGVHLYAHWTVGQMRSGIEYVVELVKKQLDGATIGVAKDPDEKARVRQSGRKKSSRR